MENDDKPIGRVLSRRETIKLVGGAGAAMILGCNRNPEPVANRNLPCLAKPEQTEGPYFVDEKLNRSDIRSDPSSGDVKEGAPLRLTINVYRVGGDSCIPLSGAYLDIWHTDAFGVYSDVRDSNFDTVGQKFLRGYQISDANGATRFTTIYPGWYWGRAVHIHFKIRMETKSGAQFDFTSQLYFDDALSDSVFAKSPYSQKESGRIRNGEDGIFRRGGDKLLLAAAEDEQGGFSATFDVGLLV